MLINTQWVKFHVAIFFLHLVFYIASTDRAKHIYDLINFFYSRGWGGGEDFKNKWVVIDRFRQLYT